MYFVVSKLVLEAVLFCAIVDSRFCVYGFDVDKCEQAGLRCNAHFWLSISFSMGFAYFCFCIVFAFGGLA